MPNPYAQHTANNRFLGWNYARRAHQDVHAWQRRNHSSGLAAAGGESSPSLFGGAKRISSMTSSGSSTALLPGFASAERLPSGALPTAVVSGDFNEDGKPDLAVSNGADNTVTVLLGDGTGGFLNPPGLLYTSGNTPVWLTTAKLTTGGHLDIISVDADSNEIEIFRGNGSGNFQAPQTLDALKQIPTYVISADFNNDGHPDLAVGLTIDELQSEPAFVVYLGDGSGNFPTKISGAPFFNPNEDPLPASSLVVSDLNQDSYPDVTVAFTRLGVAYLNQGGTSFPTGTTFNSGDGLLGLAEADVDGDGCPDAIEAGGYGLLTVAKGGCDGTFIQGNATAAVGDQDAAVLVTDVDGDGIPDIVASAAFFELGASGPGYGAPGGYTISVLKGTGGGNFAPPVIYRGAANQYSLAAADFSGSGFPDLVAVAQLDGAVIRVSNDGKGNFGTPSGEAIGYLTGTVNAPSPVSSPQVVDLNGDGRLDVLLVESGVLGSQPSQLTSLLNDGTGKLQAPVRSSITSASNPLFPIFSAADFHSPKNADVILISTYVSPYTVAYYPGNGDGSFGSPTILGDLPNPLIVQSGDVNHDGKMDFVVYGTTAGAAQNAQIDVYLGNGNGTFNHLPAQISPALLNLGSILPQQLFIADFNHDGKLDLLIGFDTNSGVTFTGDDLQLALGNGDGTFQNPKTLMSAFGPVAVGDLNHDGYLDLVRLHDPDQSITAQAVDDQGPYLAPAATVYLGQANGQFTKGATYLAPQVQYGSFSPALLGDFDGDGNLDIAIPYGTVYSRPWSFRLLILGGAGDGTFRPSGIPFDLPVYDQPVIGGDFRGTGRTDLLDLIGATSSINTISAGSPANFSLSFDALPLPTSGGTITVSLAAPAKAGESIALVTSDPAVQIPSSASFRAGEIEQQVAYAIGSGFDTTHMLAVTGTLNGYTASAYGSDANANRKAGVLASIGAPYQQTNVSAAVAPGGSVDLVFNLISQNGYSGTFSSLSCTGLPPGTTCNFVASDLDLHAGGSTDTAFQITTSPSTPLGSYPVQVSASNGAITASATLTFGVGTFTLSASPTTIPINNGSQQPYTTLTANYQNGYSNTLNVTCSGLPAGATCDFLGALYPANNIAQLSLSETALAPADYPFTITASGGTATQSIPAILRVESYTASLSQTSLTAQSGTPVNLTVNFQSVNHFTTGSIQISCQISNVTCIATPYNAVLTDGGSASVKLAITATYSSLSELNSAKSRSAASSWRSALPYLATLLLPFAVANGKARKLFLSLCILSIFTFMGACGGGQSGTGSGGSGSLKSQTIAIQLNATAQTAGNGPLTRSIGTVTLKVTE